jgi:hypothetical protein
MKKLLTIAFTLLLAGTLSFAQAGGGSTDKGAGDKDTKTNTKKGAKKGHKGGKKSKKGSGGTTTPPPK